jgi:hypothetical protein
MNQLSGFNVHLGVAYEIPSDEDTSCDNAMLGGG